MKYGFIKVGAAANEIKVAEANFNADRIIELIKKAEEEKVKLLVFPKLSLTGATCGDLFYQDVLLNEAKEALSEVMYATEDASCVVVISLPLMVEGKLFITAAVLYKGEILGFVPQNNLTTSEKRVFAKGPDEVSYIEYEGKIYPFGSEIIFKAKEMEGFSFGVELGEDLLSPTPPSVNLALMGASLIVNPSSFPEIIGMNEKIKNMAASLSERLSSSYIISNPGYGESTGDMVFSGYSVIVENGKVLSEKAPFREGINISEKAPFREGINISEIDTEYLMKLRMKREDFTPVFNEGSIVYFSMEKEKTSLTRKIEKNPFIPEDEKKADEICREVLEIQSEGLKKRILHTGAKCVVLGISGGLDSCLALLAADLTMKKLSREPFDILAVTMPCFGTSKRTKGNAEKLCEILGVNLKTIDIKDSVRQHFSDIGHDENKIDVVYENAQARERTKVLMDIANQKNGLVIGTGDLSELALGWATYNGDHMSMYGLNASVSKTLVKAVVSYVAKTTDNKALSDVLTDILMTPVSPELVPSEKGEISQKTEELVGPYELHDFFLYYMVKYGFSSDKIKYLAEYAFSDTYDKETIDYWEKTFVRRFFSQQFKRSCLPEGPKVGSLSLSPRGEFNMPSDACAGLWLK